MTHSNSAPISGEILVDDAPTGQRPVRKGQENAVDAEYVTLAAEGDSPGGEGAFAPEWRADPIPPLRVTATDPADGLAILRSGSLVTGEVPDGLPRFVFYAVSVVAVACAFWFSGGYSLLSPPGEKPAAAETLKHVRIDGLESRTFTLGAGKRIVLVNGTVVNDGAMPAGVPPLQVKISDASGASKRYVFGTSRSALGGGESFQFSYRLDAPESGVDNVAVEFARDR